MTEKKPRQFEDKPAVRAAVPLLFGIAGASGCGKTYSALRLATGMQRVTGGDIFYLDTESRRALWYADLFKFRHVDFQAPYSPLDYLRAIEHCQKQGAKIIVSDSMSHEHEGPGGVLEWHEAELERMGGGDKNNMRAWVKPKQARRRLLNSIVQLGVNAIFCFRAKDKIEMPKQGSGKKEFAQLGWVPIAGPEFVFEMTAQALQYPNSDGVPTWDPTLPGEKMMVKLPAQFRDLFLKQEKGKPLREEAGEAMARWAAGDTAKPEDAAAPTAEELTNLLFDIEETEPLATLKSLAAEQRLRAWTPEQRATIKAAVDVQSAKLKKPAPEAVPCQHPDGFAPSSENPEPHCIHCGEVQRLEQQSL